MLPVSRIRGLQRFVVVYFPGYCRRSSCLNTFWKVTTKHLRETGNKVLRLVTERKSFDSHLAPTNSKLLQARASFNVCNLQK